MQLEDARQYNIDIFQCPLIVASTCATILKLKQGPRGEIECVVHKEVTILLKKLMCLLIH